MSHRKTLTFLFALVVLMGGRIAIAGRGYLEDTDEWLYLWMHEHTDSFHSLKTWVDGIFRMQGQLPEMLIRYGQYCSVLPIAQALHKSPLHPEVLYYVGLYNIIASILILIVFYGILRRIGFEPTMSVVGMILLGTLFNYNLHTRHLLPYDHAMLLHLTGLYLLLEATPRPKTTMVAGLLSALGLVTYYGSFIFVFINGGIIVVRHWPSIQKASKRATLYILPFVFVYLSIELLTRLYAQSYFAFVNQYSGTVNMASADEGFSYILHYFYSVEKIWGLLLLFLFPVGCILIFYRSNKKLLKQVLLLGVVGYLSYGTVAYFTHKLVFHGRLLHPYYPFIIIGVLGFICYQKQLRPGYMAWIVAALAIVNYTLVIQDFNSISYPRQTIYTCGLFSKNAKERSFDYFEELPGVPYSNRQAMLIDSVGISALPQGNYDLVNIGFLAHYPDSIFNHYRAYTTSPKDSLVMSFTHFQSHPAYAMEYCTRFGREFFIARKFKIQVIKKHNP